MDYTDEELRSFNPTKGMSNEATKEIVFWVIMTIAIIGIVIMIFTNK